MRRALALAVGLLAVATPALAAGVPGGTQIGESVTPLRLAESITTIRLDVTSLQTESTAGGRTSVTIASDVLFEFGRATLTPVARGNVTAIAARLRSARRPVTVVGHTDAIGGTAANLTLSQARAATVRATLLAAAPGLAITASGRGEAQPVAPNTTNGKDDPLGRAKNRRVVITF